MKAKIDLHKITEDIFIYYFFFFQQKESILYKH